MRSGCRRLCREPQGAASQTSCHRKACRRHDANRKRERRRDYSRVKFAGGLNIQCPCDFAVTSPSSAGQLIEGKQICLPNRRVIALEFNSPWARLQPRDAFSSSNRARSRKQSAAYTARPITLNSEFTPVGSIQPRRCSSKAKGKNRGSNRRIPARLLLSNSKFARGPLQLEGPLFTEPGQDRGSDRQYHRGNRSQAGIRGGL